MQIAIVVLALFAMVSAKPNFIASPLAYSAYSAPLVAAPALATSAVVSREFHGNTSPYVAALPYSAYSAYPYASAYSAYPYASPYVASAVVV